MLRWKRFALKLLCILISECDQSIAPYNKVNQTVNRTYSDNTLAFDTWQPAFQSYFVQLADTTAQRLLLKTPSSLLLFFWVTVDRKHARRACGEATRNEGGARDKKKNFSPLNLSSFFTSNLHTLILLFRPLRVVLRKERRPLAVCVFCNFWGHAYLSLEGTLISTPQLLQRWTTDQWQAP